MNRRGGAFDQGLRALPRTVWILGLISLLNDSASELVYPLVPLYLTAVLGAGPRALGVIEGIAEAVGSLFKLVSGVLSDRTRSTKPWVVTGYGAAAAARPLLALAGTWPVVLVLRFVDRLGKGVRTAPRDALLSLSTGAHQRGLAFGLHRAMDNAGAVIGPLLAAALLAGHFPVREVFLWAAVPGALTVALALSLREPDRPEAVATQTFRWSLKGLPPSFGRYLLAVGLFTLGNSSNMFLLLRARDMGLAEFQVPLLWAATSATAAVLSTPLSALSDRVGRIRLIAGGWLIYALFYLLMGLDSTSTTLLWPLFAVYGLSMAATEGAERALVADLVPAWAAGRGYGWFNLVAGITLLPASLVFGGLWEWAGPATAFGFGAGCALVATALLAAWVRAPDTSGESA
ncbi:MAG TPA: MFS transporter [Gammaproteobacteria bacterium]|nr:MFS transporter [Gammaproteobacteria bacterium]